MNRSLQVFALFCAFVVLPACSRRDPVSLAPPPGETWLTDAQIQGARVTIAAVQKRTLDLHLVTSGRVAFDEERVAHVFSPVSGRVTRVIAPFGRRVAKGDPLAVIESPDLGSARSDAIKAGADFIAAEHEVQRQKDLFDHHATAERDYEAAQDNATKAHAEVERADLRLKMLHATESGSATQEFILRSPIAGGVINRTATPGLEVQGMLSSANIAQELFTVGEIDRVWVWGDLYERDLGKVRRGQPVTIASVASPDHPVSGSIDFVGDALDKDTRTQRLRCAVANTDHFLKPEMYVTLSIQIERREALAVPRAAVIRSGDRQIVFVEDGKAPDARTKFKQRAIEPGEGDDGWVAVQSGLLDGERVVVSGSILMSAGTQ
jgi:cobalt-zinc-cadmium efflux system membrane fusion protein